MDARLQRRIQRSGWDLAANLYEALWREPIAPATAALLRQADLSRGERVLDVACGTGLISFPAVEAVGPAGHVLGVDLSGRMVEAAEDEAERQGLVNIGFSRMDAEALDLPDASFDVALCALGLMYPPDPKAALREMCRVLRPGGRAVVSVWGERAACGWAPVFPIVDDEVTSETCPLFFRLGSGPNLAQACGEAGFIAVERERLTTKLAFANEDAACDAVFAGGPAAFAWARFDAATRARARSRYLRAIAPWRRGAGYQLPGEFVIVVCRKP